MSISSASTSPLVLVTGGSGYIGLFCILELIKKQYRVRTTVRSLARSTEVLQKLSVGGLQEADQSKIEFVAADLLNDEGWAAACRDCTYALHVASPFPGVQPKHEEDLIKPAVEGTLRVLKAARDAHVKRVVVTSSVAAVSYGHKTLKQGAYDESDWSDPAGCQMVYIKSKVLAERAAWDWHKADGQAMEMTVINPVGVFGPVLGDGYSTSISILKRLLTGEVPAVPNISFNAVDVRDVAQIHVQAMTLPEANGERFIVSSGESISFLEMANVIRAHVGMPRARKVPTRVIPDWLMRFLALFMADVKLALPSVGEKKQLSSAKAQRVFQWTPISREDSITATIDSLLQLKLVNV